MSGRFADAKVLEVSKNSAHSAGLSDSPLQSLSSSSPQIGKDAWVPGRAGFTRTLLLKVGVDTALFVLSYLTAFILRVGVDWSEYRQVMLLAILPVVGIKIAIFSMFGAYRSIWRYSSLRDLGGKLGVLR